MRFDRLGEHRVAPIEFWARPKKAGLSFKGEVRVGCAETLLLYDGEARWGPPSAALFHLLRQHRSLRKKVLRR